MILKVSSYIILQQNILNFWHKYLMVGKRCVLFRENTYCPFFIDMEDGRGGGQ